MIANSILNPVTFKNIVGKSIATPVNATFNPGIGSLADGTYYYRVSALTSIGETLASAETSLAIAKLVTPVNAAFAAGTGTLAIGTYYYRVSAVNGLGETLASAETSLALSAAGGVIVNWGAVAGATGYRIYGRTTGTELLLTTVGNVTTYLDDGSITPAGALPATNTTAGGVYVNWVAVTGAVGYKVYGRTTGAELLLGTVLNTTAFLDDGTVTPSGALPTSNTTGSDTTYPNMWNTLQVNRKHGNARIIPYLQKFNKNHTLYLQFESDSAVSIVLKSYSGLIEVESFTGAYASSYGTTDVRYYTNFTIQLGASYLDKEVYFKATQGTNTLTSEPIYTTDLTDLIARGLIKYVKYTNIDRIDSDVSGVFVDWFALPSPGYYMDFFIEAVDQEPNDTDESEVLEGSQSKTILSASYYSGKVFKTGAIPDYMATKIAMCASMDVFSVNGIQYIKSGGAEQSLFGGSTSYQLSMKLTEKNTLGINVDNIGESNGSVTPPATGTPMYVGSVASATPTETDVKTITPITAVKVNQVKVYTISNARFCFAYPTTFGALTSILDTIGDEIISGFNSQTVNFTIDGALISYKVYTLKSAVTVTSFTVQYKF